MRKLTTYVHIDGVMYGPDDEISDEVAVRITNPNVWAGDVGTTVAGDAERSPATIPSDTEAPPRAGKGSGQDAWAAYAASATDTEESSWAEQGRDDIIEALVNVGIIRQEG